MKAGLIYGVQVQGHHDSPLETHGLQKQHTKRFIDKSAYWEKAKFADTFYFADAFEVWLLGSHRKETESSKSEKKTAVLAFNLIIVIAVLWVLQGHDYVIGFIIAAGFVGFVGISLYNGYARQESK